MIHVPGTGNSRWNADLKKVKHARTVGSPFFTGSHWKQEEKDKKAQEKRERKAERKARRRS